MPNHSLDKSCFFIKRPTTVFFQELNHDKHPTTRRASEANWADRHYRRRIDRLRTEIDAITTQIEGKELAA
jgi:hypothetical protein